MQTQPTHPLIALVPVIVGGLLAVLGGVLGTLITHRLNVDRETVKSRREKLEQLVQLAYEYKSWHERKLSQRLFRQADFDEEPLHDKLFMLCSLYFPELRPMVLEITKSGIECNKWLAETWGKQQKDFPAWVDDPNRMDSYYPLAQNLTRAVSKLAEAARPLLGK